MKRKLESNEDYPIKSRLFAMFKHNRGDLLYTLKNVNDEMLDFTPDENKVESIGSLLYHIAAVDWSWVFEDIDGKKMNFEKWKYGFSTRYDNVSQIKEKPKQFYLDLIEETRNDILERLDKFSDEDLLKTYLADGKTEFTVEWMCYHLLRHEAKHIGQISLLRRLYMCNINKYSV